MTARPSPFVGFRFCEEGDVIHAVAVPDGTLIIRRDGWLKGGRLPTTSLLTRWSSDPRLYEAEPGASAPVSRLNHIVGVGISAPTKQDPGLVVDEQWGEEF